MRRIILSSVAFLLLQCLHISHKRHDFREKMIKHEVFLFSVQILPDTFLILRTLERDIIVSVQRSLRTVPVILVTFK